jgi:Flp pilus assembly protein TadD
MKQNRTEQLNEQIVAVMQAEDWLGAIDFAHHHIEIIRTDYELSWNLGWAYFKLDRFLEAGTHLLRATKLAPENVAGHWALGTVYGCLRNYKKAEASLVRSLSLKDSHIARIELALTYQKQRKFDEAEHIHREGLKLKPND